MGLDTPPDLDAPPDGDKLWMQTELIAENPLESQTQSNTDDSQVDHCFTLCLAAAGWGDGPKPTRRDTSDEPKTIASDPGMPDSHAGTPGMSTSPGTGSPGTGNAQT